MQGPEFSHGGTDLWDRRGCGTPLKPSVEDLKGLGDQVAPSLFMIQGL